MTFQLLNTSRRGGAGIGRVLPLATIGNQPHSFDNHYVPGSGVGATSAAVRRAKQRRAVPKQIAFFCGKKYT